MTRAFPTGAADHRRVIAYDITRLFIGPIFMTPRGIDRVDLALAKHLFADPASPHLGVLPTPWGVRCYPAPVVQKMLVRLQSLWSEEVHPDHDSALAALIDEIRAPHGPDSVPPETRTTGLGTRARRIVRLLQATGIRLGRPARSGVPQDAIYLNIGQLGLAVPIFHNWLEDRRDITCAIMLHDLIPLEYPHLVSDAAVAHHARMVRTAARHADCLIFNTDHAREQIAEAMLAHGRPGVPSLVRWLPLPEAFAAARESPAGLEGSAYFVVVSTIEPRKNHALLIGLWKRLVGKLGGATPHLVIVGAPGRGASDLVDTIRREPRLRSKVHLVSGLSSPALAALVLGAKGVLCPSLAEGFGLPVLEATALGVPALASDIAAHREIGGPLTTLLPVDDEALWAQSVVDMNAAGSRTRPPIPVDLTEESYCTDILAFLNRVASGAN